MEILLRGFVFPARIRFSKPMNDEELHWFSARNADLRIEREPGGEILVMSPVTPKTGLTEAGLIEQLRAWARTDRRGEVFSSSTGFKLRDGSVRIPDAAWVSFQRWNALTPSQQDSLTLLCPEFVIEVRSKSDRRHHVQTRMEMWIANGVQLAWLIDPREGEVIVYRPGESPEVHTDPSSMLGTGPVAGFELILD